MHLFLIVSHSTSRTITYAKAAVARTLEEDYKASVGSSVIRRFYRFISLSYRKYITSKAASMAVLQRYTLLVPVIIYLNLNLS